MRWDVHNHTVAPRHRSRLTAWKKQIQPETLLAIFSQHHLDGVAITNYQEIDIATDLAGQYPNQVLVGAEYHVIGHESSFLTLVVLGVDQNLHSKLLKASSRGLSYFKNVVQEHQRPYYLAHLGSNVLLDHPLSCELMEEILQEIPALLISDQSGNNDVAMGLAKYYHLTPIGGSGQLLLTNQRSYTEFSIENLSQTTNASGGASQTTNASGGASQTTNTSGGASQTTNTSGGASQTTNTSGGASQNTNTSGGASQTTNTSGDASQNTSGGASQNTSGGTSQIHTAPEMLCQAILNKQVSVGVSTLPGFPKNTWSSLWESSQKDYAEEISRVWHSELNWQQPWNFSEIAKKLFSPTLQMLPQAFQIHKNQKAQHRLQQWKQRFIGYLQLKETKQIAQLSCPASEKAQLWIARISRIYQSFG